MKLYWNLALNLDAHVRMGTYFIIQFNFKTSFLPNTVTVGKFEDTKSVISPYQENSRPNVS